MVEIVFNTCKTPSDVDQSAWEFMRKLRADTNVQKAVLDRGVQTRAQARSDELMKKEVGGAHKGLFVISSRRNCKRDNLGNSRSARLIPRSKFVRTTTI
jgi:hypothetical protein